MVWCGYAFLTGFTPGRAEIREARKKLLSKLKKEPYKKR